MKKTVLLLLCFGLLSCDAMPPPGSSGAGGNAGATTAIVSALASPIPFVNPSTGATETDPGFLFDPTSQYLVAHHLYVAADFTQQYPGTPHGTLIVQPDQQFMGFYGQVDLGGINSWSPLHSRVAVRSNEPPSETNGVGLNGGLFGLVTAGVAEARFSNPSQGETNLTAGCQGFLTWGANVNDGGNGNICYDHVTDLELGRNGDHRLLSHAGFALDPAAMPVIEGRLSAVQDDAARELLTSIIAGLKSHQLSLVADHTQ